MYQEAKIKDIDEDHVSLMQIYLRSQAARLGSQKLDWFFNQPELMDDGDHPLLEDELEPQYSRDVMRRAFTTWSMLDNKNSFKFVCNYYHALEKMAENSPPYVRDYVRRSLDVPTSHQEYPEQIFHEDRRTDLTTDSIWNSKPAFYKHHSDITYLRDQTGSDIQEFEVTNAEIHCRKPEEICANDAKTPTDEYARYCKSLSYKMHEPAIENKPQGNAELDVNMQVMKPNSDVKMSSQISIDSTPSKSSENDSCYQSMSSPLTDLEE